MTKLFILFSFLSTSCFVSAEMLTTIKVEEGSSLSPVIDATYRAQSDSRWCKTRKIDEGSGRVVRKMKFEPYYAVNGSVVVPHNLRSRMLVDCNYKLIRLGLGFEVQNIARHYNTDNVNLVNQMVATQAVLCERILSGPGSDIPMIKCDTHGVELQIGGTTTVSAKLEDSESVD